MDPIHEILALNVALRCASAFPEEATETAQFERLRRRGHIGKESIRQIRRGGRSPTLRTIQRVAIALGTTAAALLTVPTPQQLPGDFPKDQAGPKGT